MFPYRATEANDPPPNPAVARWFRYSPIKSSTSPKIALVVMATTMGLMLIERIERNGFPSASDGSGADPSGQ